MKSVVRQKAKTEAQLLDQATDRLLKATKRKLVEKYGRLDLDRLRKDGYSERFLARLESV